MPERCGGEPVFQAVHAAGILRHVAADGAGDLRGRVGRVVEPLPFHGVGDAEIGDARLRHHAAVGIVDLEDAAEAAHDQQHGVLQRQRAARQRGAGAARHDADAALVAIFEDAGNLGHGLRQHHHQGNLAVGGEAVGLEGAHFGHRVDHALARHDDAQVGDDLGTPRHRRGIWFGHRQAGHRRSSSSTGKKPLPVIGHGCKLCICAKAAPGATGPRSVNVTLGLRSKTEGSGLHTPTPDPPQGGSMRPSRHSNETLQNMAASAGRESPSPCGEGVRGGGKRSR